MLELRYSSLRVQLTAGCAIVFTPFHPFSFLSLLESTPNSTNRIYILHQRRTLGGTHPLLSLVLWGLFVVSKEESLGTHPLLPLVLWRLFVVLKEESLGTHSLLPLVLWRLFVVSKQCFMGTHPLLRMALWRLFVTSKQCFMRIHPLLRRGLGRLFVLHYEHSFSSRPRAIGLSS